MQRLLLMLLVACGGVRVGYTVEEVPPEREEVVLYKPGYIWVHGHWAETQNRRWEWRGGYYEHERPSYVYVQGHWDRRDNHNVWVDGEWKPRGHVVAR